MYLLAFVNCRCAT